MAAVRRGGLVGDLARPARGCAALRDAVVLAEWVDAGRTVTAKGVVVAPDDTRTATPWPSPPVIRRAAWAAGTAETGTARAGSASPSSRYVVCRRMRPACPGREVSRSLTGA